MPTTICTTGEKSLIVYQEARYNSTFLLPYSKCLKTALKEMCSHEKRLSSKHIILFYQAFENSGEKNALHASAIVFQKTSDEKKV